MGMFSEVPRERAAPREQRQARPTASPAAGSGEAEAIRGPLRPPDAFSRPVRPPADAVSRPVRPPADAGSRPVRPPADALGRPVRPPRSGERGWPGPRPPESARIDKAIKRLGDLVADVPAAAQQLERVREAVRGLSPESAPERFVATTRAVRDLGRALADPVRLVRKTPEERAAIQAGFRRLADGLGPRVEGLDKALRRSDSRPLELDVVAPAHDRLTVWESRVPVEPRQVITKDSSLVVQANNCRLDAREHYQVRRISLDCASLYENQAVLDAFVEMMLDPGPDSHEAFRRLVAEGRPDDEGKPRTYGQDLPRDVALVADGADVVLQGDDSRLSSTTCYHVEEAAVPLAELMADNAELVKAMAAQFAAVPPGTPAGDPLKMIRDMVDGLSDGNLLTYANELGRGAEVTRNRFDLQVNLAGAVMVGYGNKLSHTSRIGVSWSAGWGLKKAIGKSLNGLHEAVDKLRPATPPPPAPELVPPTAVPRVHRDPVPPRRPDPAPPRRPDPARPRRAEPAPPSPVRPTWPDPPARRGPADDHDDPPYRGIGL